MQSSAIKDKIINIFTKTGSYTSRARESLRVVFRHLRIAYFPLLFCFLEIVLHIFAYRSMNRNIVWVILFSFGLGSILTFLTTVFHRKVNAVLTYLFTFVSTLAFIVELVYFRIFKGFAPVSHIKLGGQAVTNFKGAMMEGIRTSVWWMLLMLVPFILLIIFGIWLRPKFSRPSKTVYLSSAMISVAFLAGTVGIMATFFNGTPSLYKTFSSSATSTDTSVNYFGLNATAIQEIKWLIFPDDSSAPVQNLTDSKSPEGAQVDPYVDFGKLYDKAGDNEALKNLTAELSNMPTTQKNDYTGLCKGYNLITICAEAFSPEFIDPELTPALYKLSTEGFIFENFYSSYPNTTTNGEYSFCMGLFPDLSRGKTDSSFSVSASNYLPYCYGNLFRGIGADAYAYHNYVAEFYYRNFTHVNMGYDFYAANSGLDIEITWPSSDYDMMVASVDDYINSGKQFTAYYMTFSGHYQYTLANAMSAKNWDTVKDLPYSDAVKAYIACNLELEYAMQYLLDRLESAGIADKTVIVLTTDHFPYGLNDSQYAELSGRDINNVFDKQKNSFICYVPGLDEPVVVDKYCSTVDILPTVLNLFGFTYDSRLLAGHDMLAPDAVSVAMIADGSFISEGIAFDSSIMKYKYDDESAETKARAVELYNLIEKRFRLSTDILNNDYYSFVYDTESSSDKIDNLTKQYYDVGIMEQSSVYYILKNDIMDPISDSSFGLHLKSTIVEVIDSIYRIAGRPEIDYDESEIPFSAADEYKDAVAWACKVGILKKDMIIFVPLTEEIKLGQLNVLLARTAAYFNIDTSVNEEDVAAAIEKFSNIQEETVRASLFCRDKKIILGDGSDYYMLYNTWSQMKRGDVTTALYKLCSYYILADKK